MARLSFEDFRFQEKEDQVQVDFLRLYTFEINKDDLSRIGRFSIEKDSISFPDTSQEKAEKQFSRLINQGFLHLTNKLTGNRTIYIHQNSGIPLIGALSFGIVDKGSEYLEVKPLTSCNADCTFCSVDEGPSSKKKLDIVVEKDYLVQEVKKISEFKKAPLHIFINPHGEPLLYAELVGLVKDLSALQYVKELTTITNGMLLTPALADKLIGAGITSINISLHSLDSQNSKLLFHTEGYRINRIRKTLESLKGRVQVILAPVLLQGINEADIGDIAAFAKEHGFKVMVQNFCKNKRGRNPVKELTFEKFYAFLESLEKKYDIKIRQDLKIAATKQLPKPFHKGEVIEAEVLFQGRYPGEYYAAAQGRCILVKGTMPTKKSQKLKITKDANNVFYAVKK